MGRKEILKEIIETERKYVTNLKLLKELYMIPLKQSADKEGKNALITNADFRKVFANLDVIMNINGELLKRLEIHYMQNNAGKKCDNSLGEIFLFVAPFFKTYTDFCRTYDANVMFMSKLIQKNERLKSFLNDVRKSPESAGNSWNSFMIMPVQRIPRYNLLLKELIKETSQYHADYDKLQDALTGVQGAANYVNQNMKDSENRAKIYDVYRVLTGIPDKFELVEAHRIYVEEGELRKLSTDKVMAVRYFWVFSDVIIYGKRSGKDFIKYSDHIELTKSPLTWIRDLPDSESLKNGFQIVSKKRTLTLYADSPEEKAKWITCISGVIDKIVASHAELQNEKAELNLGSKKNILWTSTIGLFATHTETYDPLKPPELPSRKRIPSAEVIDQIRNKATPKSMVVYTAKALWQHKPAHDAELGFKIGDIVFIVGGIESSLASDLINLNPFKSKDKPRWWLAKHTGINVPPPGMENHCKAVVNRATSRKDSKAALVQSAYTPTLDPFIEDASESTQTLNSAGVVPSNFFQLIMDSEAEAIWTRYDQEHKKHRDSVILDKANIRPHCDSLSPKESSIHTTSGSTPVVNVIITNTPPTPRTAQEYENDLLSVSSKLRKASGASTTYSPSNEKIHPKETPPPSQEEEVAPWMKEILARKKKKKQEEEQMKAKQPITKPQEEELSIQVNLQTLSPQSGTLSPSTPSTPSTSEESQKEHRSSFRKIQQGLMSMLKIKKRDSIGNSDSGGPQTPTGIQSRLSDDRLQQ